MKKNKFETKLYKELLKEGKEYIAEGMENLNISKVGEELYTELQAQAEIRIEDYFNSVVKKYTILDLKVYAEVDKENYEDVFYNIFDNIFIPFLRLLLEATLLQVKMNLYRSESEILSETFTGEVRDKISEKMEIFPFASFLDLLTKGEGGDKLNLMNACMDFNYILKEGKPFTKLNTKERSLFEEVYKDYLKYLNKTEKSEGKTKKSIK